MSEFASVESIIREAMAAWRPPPKLSLSDWADQHFYLSAESAAEAGRWRTLPYQRAIMDAFTDPSVTYVSVMKSARVGWTKVVNALVGYSIDQDPCPILVVQPTVEDAKGYSKEEIAPMLRDCPRLSAIVFEDAEENGPRDGGNTILHKRFPGGVLSLVGANSGTGFRRVSRKRVLCDEVDAYPASAGSDGDPVKLAARRAEYYWDRKIGAGSTPLVAGASRIERLFEEGDQRRYFVPCPHCAHMAPLVFREPSEEGQPAGHVMTWPEGRPDDAFFACQKNGCVIEHKDKVWMVERGEWRAARPFTGHASFHVWAAYSYSPNATWAQLAKEFIEAKDNPQTLKTFVNTVLGETWKERGEAPDWERLYQRRESYAPGSVPAGVVLLTAGVDVQKDRFVYEVVGWGAGKESWSIDADVIPADTSDASEWAKLDDLLGRTYPTAAGTEMGLHCTAVDSGYQTSTVYSWVRTKAPGRVIAVKGVAQQRTVLGAPTRVDINVAGRKVGSTKVWPVGTDMAKDELYGWLNLATPAAGAPYKPGYCHFPERGEDYFKQLTAEHLVSGVDGRGFTYHEWQLIPGRENHWLDCRVYARAAASLRGLDRMRPSAPSTVQAVAEFAAAVADAQGAAKAAPPPNPAPAPPAAAPPSPPRAPQRSGFLGGKGDRFPIRGTRKGWLR